ncbi:hypothetical protein CHS0354_017229 [Potamilus streckersoni]|uniref:C2H2-type domain-containing protein n=1 Tax=Potamilus streckersoni TaxID=2493646 RepID=A0AAE0SI52_9BIVA|nr:hypothetical protein CHS0354_017229 [Potamilus streckersoni]
MEYTKGKEKMKYSELPEGNSKRNHTTCEVCQKRVRDYYSHSKIHTVREPHKCDICNKVFLDKKCLAKHKTSHLGIKVACEICNKKIHPTSYGIHMKIHSGEKPYKCDMCGKSFLGHSGVKRHIMFIHLDEKLCKCRTCKKVFNDPNHLQRHTDSKHATEKLHKCEQCAKMFSSALLLRNHVAMHEKPYQCGLCGKHFQKVSLIKMHVQRAHMQPNMQFPSMSHGVHAQTDETAHKCEVCSKVFLHRTSLKNHLTIHRGEKPFTCEVCGKTFRLMIFLQSHKRIHTGEKPYKCEICGSAFSRKDNLIYKHMKIHTGDKPFVCPVCQKCFNRSENLKIHLKVHGKKDNT